MSDVKVIDLSESISDDNDKAANILRQELKRDHIFLMNLMSSAGAGKTTTLDQIILRLKDKYRIGYMSFCIDGDDDARKISESGIDTVVLHNEDKNYLDADMVKQGLEGLIDTKKDLVLLENIGDIITPAKYDTGACKNVMILSVSEGHDKALKYPLMFQVCDALIINKTDILPYFDFDINKAIENARMRNPKIEIFEVCARTGEGLDSFCEWLCKQVDGWNNHFSNI